MSGSPWLWIGLLLAAGPLLYGAHVLWRRGRAMEREIARLQARERQRGEYCETLGHHLEGCFCTRCLAPQHDYESTGSKEYELRSELINPDADPGALHLDSNFQPDSDYGLTRTVYQIVTAWRCTRCSHEMVTRDERKVDDER